LSYFVMILTRVLLLSLSRLLDCVLLELMCWLAYYVVQMYIPLFLVGTLMSPRTYVAMVPLTAFVGNLVACAALPLLSSRVGRRWVDSHWNSMSCVF
jgi:hypothetical protein